MEATPVVSSRYVSMLNFQKLDVYQCSIEFAAIVARVLGTLSDEQHHEATELLARVVSMLSKLSR